MGTANAKPRLPDHVQDSVVLNDGLPQLADPKYASTGDGRFLFVLGNERISSVNCGTDDTWLAYFPSINTDFAVTFDLDMIDLFLSKRMRLGSIGDIYGGGRPAGFYALDEQTVVLIDFPGRHDTLCQRVVRIDLKKQKAELIFHRTYALSGFMEADCSNIFVDKDLVATIPEYFSQHHGYVFPANPLSSRSIQEIETLFAKAQAHLTASYGPHAQVSTVKPPLFFSGAELGCFIETPHSDQRHDTTRLIVIDTDTGSVSLRQFPPGFLSPPAAVASVAGSITADWSKGGREVAVVTRFHLVGPCLPTVMAQLYLFYIECARAASKHAWMPAMLGRFFSGPVVDWLEDAHDRLLSPRTDDFVRAGILDVKTMAWTRVKATVNTDRLPDLFPLSGGHFAVASVVTEDTEASRVIGSNRSICNNEEMERIELVRNPKRVSSLTRLATIAVQRNGRINRAQLEQIAEIIG